MRIAEIPVDPDHLFEHRHIAGAQQEPRGGADARGWVQSATITVGQAKLGVFTERQIALLTTFADQAVIAIENTRLFEEVQARTRELQEALE